MLLQAPDVSVALITSRLHTRTKHQIVSRLKYLKLEIPDLTPATLPTREPPTVSSVTKPSTDKPATKDPAKCTSGLIKGYWTETETQTLLELLKAGTNQPKLLSEQIGSRSTVQIHAKLQTKEVKEAIADMLSLSD
eukprot:Filipodium_phascolosomae@DN2017_c0_g1_i1.p2